MEEIPIDPLIRNKRVFRISFDSLSPSQRSDESVVKAILALLGHSLRKNVLKLKKAKKNLDI